jgi:transcription initiation factor IIE alpha subunit
MEIECPNCGEIVEPYDYFEKTDGLNNLLNEPIYDKAL